MGKLLSMKEVQKEVQKEYKKILRNHILDIYNYGEYRHGLTSEEVNKYLRVRSKGTKYNRYSIKQLRSKFNIIAGVNTMAVVTCPKCKGSIILTYRNDVERFANQMFQGIPTYWD